MNATPAPMWNPNTKALKKKIAPAVPLDPRAALAGRARKVLGDEESQGVIDNITAGAKMTRLKTQADKARGL